MRNVTDATFDDEVLRAERPVLVDFWAPWCGPCHAVEPVLRQLESAHGERLAFAKVNVDENPLVASRYEVLSIPTAILFERGLPVETVVGARALPHYERAFQQWL